MLQTYINAAVSAIRHIVPLLKNARTTGIQTALKPDSSPVTQIDKEAEFLLRQHLLQVFPTHGFVGEEFAPIPTQDNFTWYCDPIDGTWSFINAERTFATCLTLCEGETPILAIVYNLPCDDMYIAAKGTTPTLNNIPLPITNRQRLRSCVVNFFIHRSHFAHIASLYSLQHRGIISKLVSQGGSIALALAHIAEGSNNVFIGYSDKASNKWDFAAGVLLVQSAGGIITNLAGVPIEAVEKNEIVVAATNPLVHTQMLHELRTIDFGNPYIPFPKLV
jgi:fructose-1,6-bisphosphatase/inositol monophosphatase family enzyme